MDSEATDHFVPATYQGTTHHETFSSSITVGCASGSTMQSKATNSLVLSNLPSSARTYHKFDEVHLPLVSVPKLCTHGCTVNFGHTTVTVTKDGEHLLTGTKDLQLSLYIVPLHNNNCPLLPPVHALKCTATAATVFDIDRTAQQIAFLHASAGYPIRHIFLHMGHFP